MTYLRSALEAAKSTSRKVLDAGNVTASILGYYAGLPISDAARRSMLRMHCQTNGRFTESLAPFLRLARPTRPVRPVESFLGSLSVADLRAIVRDIEINGFHIFEQRLPDDLVAELAAFARRPAIVPGYSKDRRERHMFDPAAPLGKKYSIDEAEIVQCRAMQRLMADPGFLGVAESYLRTLPSIPDVTLWWSAVHGGAASEDAGQNFHFDFDSPPGWLMFFFYLTDVDTRHGPHIFARGSHKPGHPAAAALRSRGYSRITDDEVADAFGRENIVELIGKRGTILAVDTRGFHKGKPLEEGYRLMGQVVYAFPQFGGAHVVKQTLPAEVDPTLKRAIAANPRVYNKFL